MKFPDVFDSTIMSAARACPHKFFLEHLWDWKPSSSNVHLHAGGSFAKGLEVAREAFYTQGLPSLDAQALGLQALLTSYGDFECPDDSAKSASRMAGALEFYFDNYPLGEDGAEPIVLPSGRRGIEISFAEPLPIAHPETGDPLLYCGRLDMAVNYAGGLFGEDDKTTSSLGATWSKQWDLRAQFTGYTWGLWKAAGIKPQGMLIRGVSILKTKYDTQQAITYRPDYMIDEWFSNTCDLIEDMIRNWKRSYWRKDTDSSCVAYGGCPFRAPCMSNDPQAHLDTHYVRRHWNPLTREETLL